MVNVKGNGLVALAGFWLVKKICKLGNCKLGNYKLGNCKLVKILYFK